MSGMRNLHEAECTCTSWQQPRCAYFTGGYCKEKPIPKEPAMVYRAILLERGGKLRRTAFFHVMDHDWLKPWVEIVMRPSSQAKFLGWATIKDKSKLPGDHMHPRVLPVGGIVHYPTPGPF